MTSTLTSRPLRSTLAVVLLFLTAVTTMVGAERAHAAPGDPFNLNDGKIFLSQGYPDTSLYELVQEGSNATFELVGSSTIQYNAIGLNTNDGYVYGIRSDDGAKRELLRIGQGGVITSLGLVTGLPTPKGGYNQGTFGTGANSNILYVRDSGVADRMWAVNVTTEHATMIKPDRSVPNLSDIVYRNDAIWGVDGNARMWRINPANNVVRDWDISSLVPKEAFGGQWVYGNGNIGLSANATGKIYQISITDATTTTPTFTLVSVVDGQGSGNNDGTSVPGRADLGIVKSAPRVYAEGTKLTYTLTVTNHGPGTSTGSIGEDVFPNTFWTWPDITTTTPGCSFNTTDPYPRKMTCLVGTLAVGESWDIEVTAQTYSNNYDRINTATVAGNEQDTNLANNSSTFTSTPARINLVKSVSPTTVTHAGQQVTYSFVVTNQSKAALKDVVVNDTLAAPAGPALTVNCPKTTLAGGTDPNNDGESMKCTATYTVTQADVDRGRIDNTANASSTAVLDGSAWVSHDSSATVTIAQTPGLSVVKSASVAEVAAAGQSIDYSFLVTNIGNVTMSNIAVNDQLAAPAGPALDVSCPVTTLAPAATTTCTATYVATQADVDHGRVNNTAIVTGETPSGTPVTSGPSTVEVLAPQTPDITVVKSADVTEVTAAGQSIDYSFLVTNTGNVTLADVTVADQLAAPAGPALDVTCPVTTLAPAATTTCTATYTVTQADVDHGSIGNTATAAGKTPSGDDVSSDPSTVTVTADAPITVVPEAPVLEQTCNAESSVVVPEMTGVVYTTTRDGNTVTVTATAADGYVLDAMAEASWTFDVTALECNGPEIPMTGGTGTGLLTLVGLGLLAVTAAAGLLPRRTGVAL